MSKNLRKAQINLDKIIVCSYSQILLQNLRVADAGMH